jgi:hypothetical protein
MALTRQHLVLNKGDRVKIVDGANPPNSVVGNVTCAEDYGYKDPLTDQWHESWFIHLIDDRGYIWSWKQSEDGGSVIRIG